MVTGGEALYADLGHFGVAPIRRAWLWLVFPALLLGYMGQGALVLSHPEAMDNPFFAQVPAGLATIALVLLSSAATVIASQALISGAFSLTRQAMVLGYFPNVTVHHTSEQTEGQIYIPEVNALLAVGCLALVLTFRESVKLAAAYGIAVTGTMAITSILFFIVARWVWNWPMWKAVALLLFFLSFDLPFLAANLFKFLEGGYVPVLIGASLIAAMLIWNRGRTSLEQKICDTVPHLRSSPGADPSLSHQPCSRNCGLLCVQRRTCSTNPGALCRALPLVTRKRHSVERHHGESPHDPRRGKIPGSEPGGWFLASGIALWIYGASAGR